MTSFQVEHQPGETRGRFLLLLDGERVGKMTYSKAGESMIIVDHTETDDSIRGKGGAKVLFYAMVDWARETQTRVRATCPFAISMFDREPEHRDVYDG